MAVILPQSMQSDLQSSLAVLPNNGNPAGAYNMPQGETAAQAAAPVASPYDFLKPSPYMDVVNTILRDQDVAFEQAMFEMKNPQSRQQYNLRVDEEEGRFDIVPLNDYGMTMGANAFDDEPLMYTLPNPNETPQYVPVLPEE